MKSDPQFLATLDPGIREAVRRLRDAGVETFESCEGGDGHAYAEPTVRFHGDRSEGFRALAVVVGKFGLEVRSLRRLWQVVDGEPAGPYWELVFDLHSPAGYRRWWNVHVRKYRAVAASREDTT